MKKNNKFLSLASALLLASSAGFVSCSSDSDVSGNNSGGGVAGQVVKTQFAINIPYAKGSENANARMNSTRMTDKNTQASIGTDPSKFLGITDIHLLAFKNTPSTGTEQAESNISIQETGIISKDTWRTIYQDVEIPQETSSFVFYAQAGRQANVTDTESGVLTQPGNLVTSLSDVKFGLKNIYTPEDGKTLADEEAAKEIIKNLNLIAASEVEFDETNKYTVKWSNVNEGFGEGGSKYQNEAERTLLNNLYSKFTSLNSGSITSVVKTIESLRNILGADETPSPLIKTIKANCASALSNLETYSKAAKPFPNELGLPDGVARVKFENSEFKFLSEFSQLPEDGASTTTSGASINTSKIAYPARLSYAVTSSVMVSDTKITSSSSLPDYNKWINGQTSDQWGSGLTEGSVKASTRTVVLKDPVKYSVANLKLTAKCSSDELEDGSGTDNKVTVTEAGFPITAVLVGGQPATVDWKFDPTDNNFDYTIYDTDMNKTGETSFCAKKEEEPSTCNYTLVLDNKKSADPQDNVYVTIELTNNSGKDFTGKDGLIPSGAKFYLVGAIDPSKNTATDKTDDLNHVFVKGHTTLVNLTIKNLKNAYNCIPDLRSTQISLGLAVDMTWKEGIKFDVDI